MSESADDQDQDEEIDRLIAVRRQARSLRAAARRALRLARRYRTEEGPRGARETACVRQALMWRASARDLKRKAGPGLARASVPPISESARQSG